MMLRIPKKALLLAAGSGGPDVDTVYDGLAYTASGTQTSRNIGFSPDLVWFKFRGTYGHYLFTKARGIYMALSTNDSSGQQSISNSILSFDANGYTVGANFIGGNSGGSNYMSWAFKAAPKFFKTGTIAHTTGTATNIDLSELGTVGSVIVKPYAATTDWWWWHRSLTAGTNLRLNSVNAASSSFPYISVSGTTMSWSASAPSQSLEYYAFAHQPTGIIQCGGFSAAGSKVVSTVDLGWQPQYLILKSRDTALNPALYDTQRSFTTSSGLMFNPNTSGGETTDNNTKLTASGFSHDAPAAANLVYIAIKKGAA